jgi:hypothetical protein
MKNELLLQNKRISITGLTLIVILLMGAGCTWLDLLQPPEYITAILAFVPGKVGLLALRAWQRSTGASEAYLKFRPLSFKGVLALVSATALMLPIIGASTCFKGRLWLPALVLRWLPVPPRNCAFAPACWTQLKTW